VLDRILISKYKEFEEQYPLPNYVRSAIRLLMRCRTEALGGHVLSCPDNHVRRAMYNSCGHRFCPKCAFRKIEQWLDKQRSRLLACDHYHVIFTIPSELNELWLSNVKVMFGLLFRSVSRTLLELLEDEKYLGARPGIIATLHTWGRTLILHPHIHCLVTGGGLTRKNEWREVSNGFLLPVRVVFGASSVTRYVAPFEGASLHCRQGYVRSRWRIFSTNSVARNGMSTSGADIRKALTCSHISGVTFEEAQSEKVDSFPFLMIPWPFVTMTTGIINRKSCAFRFETFSGVFSSTFRPLRRIMFAHTASMPTRAQRPLRDAATT
jgi:hypothetical protein